MLAQIHVLIPVRMDFGRSKTFSARNVSVSIVTMNNFLRFKTFLPSYVPLAGVQLAARGPDPARQVLWYGPVTFFDDNFLCIGIV